MFDFETLHPKIHSNIINDNSKIDICPEAFLNCDLFFENNFNLYDESFIYAQDYKLMSDLLKRNYKISIIKEPLYHLNTKNNISTIYSKEQKYYANCVRNNIIPIEKA